MKATKSILASLMLIGLFSLSAMAQQDAKVIAVVNRADWCPICKANGKRAHEVFMENNKDHSIKFLTNDLTNAETIGKSDEVLKKYGLDKIMKNYNGTGVIFFFNPKTKALIEQISAAQSNKELMAAMQTAKKSVN